MRVLSKLKLLFVVALFGIATIVSAQKKPNILWIYADDLSYELGCYGNHDLKTPNIDKLAAEGTLFTKSYSTAPVCSSSRSSMITGMYPVAVNCQDHRTIDMTELPEGVKPVTEYFKEAGYFCSNMNGLLPTKPGKKDFNFIEHKVFDGVDWNERKPGQPFYAQINIKYPHRSFHHDEKNPIDPDKVTVPACYPNHELLRADWALYLESIQLCDQLVGDFIARLEKEGELDNTIIFFFGDNGRPHLRDKQFLYEGGLQVPLIIRYPKSIKQGKVDHQLVSLIDVTATSLDMAGIKVPENMHGKVFIGKNAEKRKYIYGFRDRAGDGVDNIRSITDGRYKLIWNRKPEVPWMIETGYKKSSYPAFALYYVLHQKGELKAPYNQFMAKTKPEFEFFDLKKDPMEFNNLADNKKYQNKKEELFNLLSKNVKEWEKNMIPEDEATTKKAIEASHKYYKSSMKSIGLSEDPTFEEILNYWEKELLKK